MHRFGGLVITRRAALQGLGLAAGLALANTTPSPTPSPTPTPSPSSVPETPPSLSPAPLEAGAVSLDELLSAKTFDAAWTTETLTSFPRVVRIAPLAEDAQLVVRWDSRLFAVGSKVFARTSEIVPLAEPTISELGELAIVIPAGAVEIYLDVRGINLYPLENVGDVALTAVSLVDSRGTALAVVEAAAEHNECAPWGVTVSAEWATRDAVIVPTLVSIASVGPNPVPAETAVEIRAAGVNVAGARISGPTVLAPGGGGITVATLTSALGPGEVVDITLPASPDASAPQKSPKSIARAAFRLPDVMTGVRATEREAAFPLTPSGTPVSSFEANASA